MNKTARQTAFEILLRMEKDGAFSNLTIDSVLSTSKLDTRDKAFVSALVYGTSEKKLTLDYQLSQYLLNPINKLKKDVLVILRLSAYQIFFMDKVPSSAAVNEGVNLARNNKMAFAASMINAVLRKCVNNGLVYDEDLNENELLSVKYSVPLWLVNKWIKEYGCYETENLLMAFSKKAETIIRVNTLKTTADELKLMLEKFGIKSEFCSVENSLILNLGGMSIEELDLYKKGYFHVQDIASQLCAEAVCATENKTVFDLCSAPGGKAFTIAQHMKNSGKIFCFDLYEHRVRLIADGAKRLGIDIINAVVGDACLFNDTLPEADIVLCDVPCSGFGIIRRKPEIRYKDPDSVKGLPSLQLEILENGSKYVKDGGRLIYSTCTLNKGENEKVCLKFLERNPEFSSVKPLKRISDETMVTLMPHKNNSDGFFIAAFERKGKQNA
ncbi:MAG: 16S rRNA (cytosine(967)-C(5))-methyltransferase RsmB [Clostridia bacterium]|nr:16S rRNA (cytosine(967)-C(5))-methyltransferase RsmB [Clostridia bacterium]